MIFRQLNTDHDHFQRSKINSLTISGNLKEFRLGLRLDPMCNSNAHFPRSLDIFGLPKLNDR